jgi:hypothetical protein
MLILKSSMKKKEEIGILALGEKKMESGKNLQLIVQIQNGIGMKWEEDGQTMLKRLV